MTVISSPVSVLNEIGLSLIDFLLCFEFDLCLFLFVVVFVVVVRFGCFGVGVCVCVCVCVCLGVWVSGCMRACMHLVSLDKILYCINI